MRVVRFSKRLIVLLLLGVELLPVLPMDACSRPYHCNAVNSTRADYTAGCLETCNPHATAGRQELGLFQTVDRFVTTCDGKDEEIFCLS